MTRALFLQTYTQYRKQRQLYKIGAVDMRNRTHKCPLEIEIQAAHILSWPLRPSLWMDLFWVVYLIWYLYLQLYWGILKCYIDWSIMNVFLYAGIFVFYNTLTVNVFMVVALGGTEIHWSGWTRDAARTTAHHTSKYSQELGRVQVDHCNSLSFFL